MSFWVFLMFVAGLVLLVAGAELLVRGASRLAAAFGIPPLIIGLTVVAFGTSAPELAVSIGAAYNNQASIALGNVVGSNIFNILLILGLSAVIAPLTVHAQLVRIDVPILIGVSLLVMIFTANGLLGRAEGIVLFLGGLLYTAFLIRQSMRTASPADSATPPQPHAEPPAQAAIQAPTEAPSPAAHIWNLLFIVIGLAMLVIGAGWLVDSAVVMADALGLSQLVIGLTIVAGGTSLPEVATSIVAALRGERDIAVGNVVGSNLFNLLLVLGLTATVSPAAIAVPAAALAFDLPVMTLAAIACLPILFTGYRIDRWEGWLFLGYYIAYVVYLILQAERTAGQAIFQQMVLYFALPLTVITLGIALARELQARRGSSAQ